LFVNVLRFKSESKKQNRLGKKRCYFLAVGYIDLFVGNYNYGLVKWHFEKMFFQIFAAEKKIKMV